MVCLPVPPLPHWLSYAQIGMNRATREPRNHEGNHHYTKLNLARMSQDAGPATRLHLLRGVSRYIIVARSPHLGAQGVRGLSRLRNLGGGVQTKSRAAHRAASPGASGR